MDCSDFYPKGAELGIAWYAYPNESHNSDGGHTEYLDDPTDWRDRDGKINGFRVNMLVTFVLGGDTSI